MKNLKKGFGIQTMQIYFSDSSKAHFFSRVRMTKIYIWRVIMAKQKIFSGGHATLFVILILPLALLMKNLKKGCGAPAMQIYFSDSSKAHFFSRVRMTEKYICRFKHTISDLSS